MVWWLKIQLYFSADPLIQSGYDIPSSPYVKYDFYCSLRVERRHMMTVRIHPVSYAYGWFHC